MNEFESRCLDFFYMTYTHQLSLSHFMNVQESDSNWIHEKAVELFQRDPLFNKAFSMHLILTKEFLENEMKNMGLGAKRAT